MVGSILKEALQRRYQKLRDFELPTEVLLGYFAAVGASSAGLWIIPSIIGFASQMLMPSLVDAAHLHSMGASPSPLVYPLILFATVFLSLFTLPFALFCTLPTFTLFCTVAFVYRIEFWMYYVVGGAAMALPIALTIARGELHLSPTNYAPLSLWSLVACGALGGLVFWWIAVKRGRVMRKLGQRRHA